LTISITDPEVKIICKRIENGEEKTRELIYHADGRTETARTFYGDHEGKAKTSWHENKLVSNFLIDLKDRHGTVSANVTQEWKVSSDGKALTSTQTFRQSEIPVRAIGGSSREAELAAEQARILSQLLPTSEIVTVFERANDAPSSPELPHRHQHIRQTIHYAQQRAPGLIETAGGGLVLSRGRARS